MGEITPSVAKWWTAHTHLTPASQSLSKIIEGPLNKLKKNFF